MIPLAILTIGFLFLSGAYVILQLIQQFWRNTYQLGDTVYSHRLKLSGTIVRTLPHWYITYVQYPGENEPTLELIRDLVYTGPIVNLYKRSSRT